MVRLRRFLVSGLSLNPAARLPAKTSKKEVKMYFRPKELASNFYLSIYLSVQFNYNTMNLSQFIQNTKAKFIVKNKLLGKM